MYWATIASMLVIQNFCVMQEDLLSVTCEHRYSQAVNIKTKVVFVSFKVDCKVAESSRVICVRIRQAQRTEVNISSIMRAKRQQKRTKGWHTYAPLRKPEADPPTRQERRAKGSPVPEKRPKKPVDAGKMTRKPQQKYTFCCGVSGIFEKTSKTPKACCSPAGFEAKFAETGLTELTRDEWHNLARALAAAAGPGTRGFFRKPPPRTPSPCTPPPRTVPARTPPPRTPSPHQTPPPHTPPPSPAPAPPSPPPRRGKRKVAKQTAAPGPVVPRATRAAAAAASAPARSTRSTAKRQAEDQLSGRGKRPRK
ncbi:hypothetical protein C8R47DRAFT_1083614 [Mycena vitilis]|nr:hypothetical protein C8R47DRAFT_1083614 [Mycena vitilis]